MKALHLSSAAAVAARSAVAAASLLFDDDAAVLSIQDSLSGVFGSVSMTAWICLLLPQLIQNYKAQRADGLSMAFLCVWLVGDVANLFGALWSGLAPTALALACYFCVADVVLVSQCVYYNTLNARRAALRGHGRRGSSATAVNEDADADDEADEGGDADADGDADEGSDRGGRSGRRRDTDPSEQSPLLSRRRSSSIGLPGSHRRHATRRSESRLDPLRRIITGEDDTPDTHPWVNNALSLVAVYAVGAAGYFVSYRMGAWHTTDGDDDDNGTAPPEDVYAQIGMILGYCSAACYLCARIPQIVKNYREKSCEGLALLFFLLSLTGNATYGASLVFYSQEREYLLKALPWLLGSVGTMVEDCIIFVQFRLYAPERKVKAAASEAA